MVRLVFSSSSSSAVRLQHRLNRKHTPFHTHSPLHPALFHSRAILLLLLPPFVVLSPAMSIPKTPPPGGYPFRQRKSHLRTVLLQQKVLSDQDRRKEKYPILHFPQFHGLGSPTEKPLAEFPLFLVPSMFISVLSRLLAFFRRKPCSR